MGSDRLNGAVRDLCSTLLACQAGGLTDQQLLQRFLVGREQAAFEALVRRHGPMVLGVCRRILGHAQDAEDAFQATFLVLARKAGSIRRQEAPGHWLYGVACRTARKAKARAARRRSQERQVPDMPHPQAHDNDVALDLQPVLDEELSRLPDRYRAPVVLCDLQGVGRKEAARQLGCPEGTLSSRLARARTLLRTRLARRGVTSMGLALLAPAPVPAALVSTTVKAAAALAAGAAGAVAAEVLTLTEGVLKAMFLTRLRVVSALVLLVSALGLGTLPLARLARADEKPEARRADRPAPDRTPSAGPREDEMKLWGVWKMVAYDVGGLHLVPEAFRKQPVTLTFGADNTAVIRATDPFSGAPIRARATYRLDPDTRPRAIRVTVTPPGQKQQVTLHGIYALDGDALRVHFAFPGEDRRPTGFAATGTGGTVRISLRRAPSAGDGGADGGGSRADVPAASPAGRRDLEAEVARLRQENRGLRAEVERLRAQAGRAARQPFRLDRLLREQLEGQKSDEQVLEVLYLAALARFPTAEESRFAARVLALRPSREEGFTALRWLLTNSQEFLDDLDARRHLDPRRPAP